MPRNKDIKKVLVIGSGPIIIGQAAEFDYAGTQACRSLKEEGMEVVLLNSNPATIMTDKDIADRVYIEPLTVEVVEQLILKEKPDSVLPTLGGQAGLNLAMELEEKGFLKEHNVRLIGTTAATIRKAEDRQEFKDTMEKIGEPVAASKVVTTVEDGVAFTQTIGYPVVLRPAYTLGGSGGGIAYNEPELREILENGLRLSRVGEVLVERCIAGWKEIEYEVMRDSADTRALTKILREKGTMNGMITVDENYDLDTIIPRLKAYTTGKVVEKVSCREKEVLKGNGPKVALLDLGAKKNIARSLNERGCQVTIYPALTSAEEILGDNPDGIMLSNGPGDPKECTSIIKEIKKLYDSDVPIFAICLGHQLMALATGGDTHKMKYGHRGGNHPVKDLETGRVYISSQNHGYVVDAEGLEEKNIAHPAFVNVNDGTNEGMAYNGKNIFTVQFHPEACPGPQDSSYLFDRFMKMMGGEK